MKKILLLTACASIVFAEDPAPSEQAAQQEIESFLSSDQNSSMQPPSQETVADAVKLTTTELPATNINAKILTTQGVELSTDSPPVPSSTLDTAQGLQTADNPPAIVEQPAMDLEEDIAAIELEEKEVADEVKSDGIIIDLGQVFAGSPTIYTVLFGLSIASLGIWVYTLLRLRTQELLPSEPLKEIREKLQSKQYNEALALCEKNPTILTQMVSTGIASRLQGQSTMLELMKSEGRRASTKLWQKIALLNDIAVIAPMLGLLGTVLGMFYAFYDLNRSMESISALFDGLGISVGTTVGGLIVAILALVFHAVTKYRLTRQLSAVEQEAHTLAYLIDNQG